MLVRKKTVPVKIEGTVIDIETTGLPHEGAEVVTLGTVSGNQLQILQRADDQDFPESVREALSQLPRPFYAFNKGFEEAMLGVLIDGELQAERYEKKSRAISVSRLHDPFSGNGFDVVSAWRKYKSAGDMSCLAQIMDHNESDLLLETCLLVVRHSKGEAKNR